MTRPSRDERRNSCAPIPNRSGPGPVDAAVNIRSRGQPVSARHATGLVLLAVGSWGLLYPAAATVLEVLPPRRFVGFRFLIGGLLLIGLFVIRRRLRPAAPQGVSTSQLESETHAAPLDQPRRSAAACLAREAALGLLGYGVYQILWIEGLHKVGPSNASILISTSPLFGVVISRARGEQVRVAGWAGLLVGLLGVWLVAGRPGMTASGGSSASSLGTILSICAAATWAAFVELQRRFTSAEPLRATALGMLAGALVILALPEADPRRIHVELEPLHVVCFSFAAIAGAAAFVWWSRGVRTLGVARAMPFMYGIPVVAMCASALLIGERLEITQLVGCACVTLGVWAGIRGARTTRDARVGSKGSVAACHTSS